MASRRAKITPQQAGLPAYGGNRRMPGPRREEVAMLAGVSIEYYARMERGQLAGASPEVLDAPGPVNHYRTVPRRAVSSRRHRQQNANHRTREGCVENHVDSKVHNRLLTPLLAADQPPAPPEVRHALEILTHHTNRSIALARPQAA